MLQQAQMSENNAGEPALALIIHGKEIGPGYLMAFMTNHYLGPVYKTIEAEFGLTSPEFVSLMCAVSVPGINSIDISRSSGRPRNSISRAVGLLAGKGLISIEADPSDGRRKRLVPTREGITLYRRLEPLFEARHSAMLRVLTGSERRMLESLLRKLAFRSDGWASPY